MLAAAAVAVAAGLCFAALAPPLGRRMRPAPAAAMLVTGAVLSACCTAVALGSLAVLGVGRLPALAALGSWSPARLSALDPVPNSVAAASLLALGTLAVPGTLCVTRRVRELLAVHRAYRAAPGPPGGLVMLPDQAPRAFATPAPGGRVVVSSGLWDALNAEERRAVLAHERCHVDHRHSWWRLAVDVAAAADPLLRPTARVAANALERWADAAAADVLGDRRLVARTIARVALLQQEALPRSAVPHPAATGGDLPRRVRALLAPTPPRRPLVAGAVAALLLVGSVAALGAAHTGEEVFDRADPAPAAHSVPASDSAARAAGQARHRPAAHGSQPPARIVEQVQQPR